MFHRLSFLRKAFPFGEGGRAKRGRMRAIRGEAAKASPCLRGGGSALAGSEGFLTGIPQSKIKDF